MLPRFTSTPARRPRLTKLTAAGLICCCLIGLSAPPVAASTFGWLRDGVVYVRGSADTVQVGYENAYLSQLNKNHVYFQSPSGELLALTELDAGDIEGSFPYVLGSEIGDYAITFAAQTHRKYWVAVPEPLPAVFRPPKFHISLQLPDAPNAFYFFVPPGTPRFTVNARRDHNSTVDSLLIYDPTGARHAGISCPSSQLGAYFPFDSHEVIDPDNGFWHVEFTGIGTIGKVACWLDDLPNYFALDPADWFIPELEPGSSMVEGSAVAGRVGKIGGVLGGNPIPEVIDNVVLLGLESNNYYIGHGYREPVNDNADPFDINWNAFNWNDDQRIEIYSESPCHMELTEIFHPAGWLPAPITDQRDMEELAEMLEVYLLHHNLEQGRSLRFFTPLDEPNNRNYEMIGYAQLAATLGRRKNQSPFPQVSDALLLVPGSSQFEEPSSTGAPGQEWAEYCYQLYDADVDGINFHQWGWRNLLNLHRYRTEVEIAHAIIATNDADGDTLETIVIDQTCINSGDGSSPYEVNSFYAALWWAGVVCNALGTGYVDALNWFNTVDDPHHKKGLMYGPDDGYAIKPVGWATRFLIESKLDEVIPTRATHPEVDVLTSVDGGRTRCHLLLVNKGERTNAVTCAISLPSAMPGLYSLEIYALRDGMSYPELVDSSVFAGQTIDIEYTLPPRSIYAFRFDGAPVAIDDRRGPGWEMAPRTGAVWAAPTPFSLSTGIEFAVNRPGMAELRIHDPGGRLVRAIARQITSAGPARIAWDGRDGRRQPVASGIYFYRLRLPSGTVHHGRVMRLR